MDPIVAIEHLKALRTIKVQRVARKSRIKCFGSSLVHMLHSPIPYW
jgi:hypothetical protein